MLGANGAALGLLAAWYVDDRSAARRGDDRESDLLGVYVIAAVLLLLPLAVTEASVVAGFTGAAGRRAAGPRAAAVRAPLMSHAGDAFTDEELERARSRR